MSNQGNGKNPPRRPPLDDSGFDKPARSLSDGMPPPKRSTSAPAPVAKPVTNTKALGRPSPLAKPRLPPPRPTTDKADREAREQAKQAAKLRDQMEKTGFSGSQPPQAKHQALIAATPLAQPAEDEHSLPPVAYDGETPDPAVTSRDLWKAIHPPVQSREGKRSVELYRQAIDQFGVAKNPRYQPEDSGTSRAHIFIWDLSKAMGAEVPHFMGNRELSFIQTVDWIRYEGGDRGWLKCELSRALQAADTGMPVIALPKDLKMRALAVVRPEERAPDGKPLFAALSGSRVALKDALGVFAAEFYFHA